MWAYGSNWTFFSTVSAAPHCVPASFRSNANLRLALAWAPSICFLHVCLLSKVTPRYVVLSVCCSFTFSKIIFTRFAFVDNVNRVVNDFVLLIFTHQSCVHLDNMLTASCSLSCAVVACSSLHHSTRSSAYIAHFTASGNCLIRSLMKISNSVSDRTLPCGTPCLRRTFLLYALSTVSLALRLCRYDLIQLYMFPPIPHRLSLRSNLSIHTLSNAFWRSIQIANVCLLAEIHLQFPVRGK